MLDFILGVSLLLIGSMILFLQIKYYIEGYLKKENEFGIATFSNLVALGIILIMIGIYFI